MDNIKRLWHFHAFARYKTISVCMATKLEFSLKWVHVFCTRVATMSICKSDFSTLLNIHENKFNRWRHWFKQKGIFGIFGCHIWASARASALRRVEIAILYEDLQLLNSISLLWICVCVNGVNVPSKLVPGEVSLGILSNAVFHQHIHHTVACVVSLVHMGFCCIIGMGVTFLNSYILKTCSSQKFHILWS